MTLPFPHVSSFSSSSSFLSSLFFSSSHVCHWSTAYLVIIVVVDNSMPNRQLAKIPHGTTFYVKHPLVNIISLKGMPWIIIYENGTDQLAGEEMVMLCVCFGRVQSALAETAESKQWVILQYWVDAGEVYSVTTSLPLLLQSVCKGH